MNQIEGLGAIVFDLDGTLVDAYEAIADALNHTRAYFELGPLPLAEVRAQVGHGLEVLIKEQLGPERIDEGVRIFRQRYGERALALTKPLPGVPEVPRALAQGGFLIGCASNKPERFLRATLDEVGLGPELIPHCLGPDEGRPPKPDPAILLAVLERLGVAPAAALYVGDMPLDAETARRAGTFAALVPTGSAPREELEALVEPPARTLIESLAELPGIVGPRPLR